MIAAILILVTAGILFFAQECLSRRQCFLCRTLVLLALLPTALAILFLVYA